MPGTLTAANAVLMLTLPPIFPVPQQLQGFGVDDVFDIPAIRSVETQMGVDGIFSGGFTFVPIPQSITLQANSASNDLFDTWWTQMQAAKDVYVASMLVRIPAIGKKYVCTNGQLTSYKPSPGVKRILQPRTHEITWGSIVPANA